MRRSHLAICLAISLSACAPAGAPLPALDGPGLAPGLALTNLGAQIDGQQAVLDQNRKINGCSSTPSSCS